MKNESILNDKKTEAPITPETSNRTENINDIRIKDLANEKLALLDELEQEKNLTEEQIKQFEYLGGKENIDETTEEVKKRISSTIQKIKDLFKKARKAIMIIATVANLNSQAEAMTNQAKNSDFGQNNIELGKINTVDKPNIVNIWDYANPIVVNPESTDSKDSNQEPKLDGPEGEGYKEVLKRIEEDLKNYPDPVAILKYSDLEGLSDSEKMMVIAEKKPDYFLDNIKNCKDIPNFDLPTAITKATERRPDFLLYYAKDFQGIEGFDLPTAMTKAADLRPDMFFRMAPRYLTDIDGLDLYTLVYELSEKYPYAVLSYNLNQYNVERMGLDYKTFKSDAINNIKKFPEQISLLAEQSPDYVFDNIKDFKENQDFPLMFLISEIAEKKTPFFLQNILSCVNIDGLDLTSLVNEVNEKYPDLILRGNLNREDANKAGLDYETLESNAISNIKKFPEQISLLAEKSPGIFMQYFREFKDVEGIGRHLILFIDQNGKNGRNNLTDQMFSQNMDIIPDILSKIKEETPLDYYNNLKVFRKYLPYLDIEKEKQDIEKDVDRLKKLWEKGRIPWKDHWWFNKEVKREILVSIGNVDKKEVQEKMNLLNQVEIANILMPILKHVPILNKYIKDLARNYMDADQRLNISPQKFINGKIDKDLDEKTKGRSLRDAFLYRDYEGFTPAPDNIILPTLPERLQKRNPHMNWFLGYGHGQEVPAEELSTERKDELHEVIRTGKPSKWIYGNASNYEVHISNLEMLDNVANYAERIELGKDGKPYVVAFDIWDFGPEYGSWGYDNYKKYLSHSQGSALEKLPNKRKGEGQVGIIVNMPIVGYEEMLKEE